LILGKSKCESNRGSKKTSPNNTLTANPGNNYTLIGVREARTKPTSPERSFVMMQSFKPATKKSGVVQNYGGNHNIFIANNQIDINCNSTS